ncbi:MAG: DUF2470 domain-containing protein [Rhizobiales bacterium]|nr:DUF2470 domain-containing protein [Hyphomicrobiales bacterium]
MVTGWRRPKGGAPYPSQYRRPGLAARRAALNATRPHDFPDFSFWRIEADSFHINGGFARAAELQPGHVLTSLAGAEELVDIEADAVQHMNQDHPEALERYAGAAGEGGGPWRTSGIDPEGIDLAAGDRAARLFFPQRVVDGRSLRAMLVALGKEATTKG